MNSERGRFLNAISSGNQHVCASGSNAHFGHAPQHVTETDMRGVSDPAWRSRGRGGGFGAGSVTPHPCCDSVLGRSGGRHKTPPAACAGAATS